jgi:hypothetical protein
MIHAAALSPTELKLIADLLATATGEFSEQSCNDYTLALTDEHRSIAVAIIEHQAQVSWDIDDSPESCIEQVRAGDGPIQTLLNYWVSGYLSHRCQTSSYRLSATELKLAAEQLEWAADLHQEWSDGDPDAFGYTLEATTDNKALLAAVIEHHGAKGWKAQAKKINAAKDEITTPDYWIARYLAERCKQLESTAPANEAASGDEAAAKAASTRAPTFNPIPTIERMGIAARFPRIKPYLKSYSMGWRNWQDQELAQLQRYSDEGPGFVYGQIKDVGDVHYNFKCVGSDLDRAAMSLRWHAIQAAFGVDVLKTTPAPSGVSACSKVYEKLRERAPHIHSRADDDDTKDYKIASHLLVVDGFSAQDVEQALLASPRHAQLQPERRQEYAASIAQGAANSSDVIRFLAQKVRARAGLESYSRIAASDWRASWQRAIAYAYYASDALSRRGDFRRHIATLANCLALGWEERALQLAQRAHWGLVNDYFGHAPGGRTQYFVLRLIDDWQGWSHPIRCKEAADDPLFNALIAHWRTPDPDALAPLLLAACDRRTHESRYFTGNDFPELPSDSHWYDPFEILAVLYLRRLHGLPNPVLDHPLMTPPLGVLPEAAPVYTDALIEGVMARVRAECPE